MGGGEEGVDKKTEAKFVAGLTARIVKNNREECPGED